MMYPSKLSWKQDMGTDATYELAGKSYTPISLSALILKQLKEAAEERLQEPIRGAVITIPAYFSDAMASATKKAAEEAGLTNVRLLPEPIAAALAYHSDDKLLVYDLGGGTFDVAIIDCYDLEMLGLDGNNRLGGDNFDDRLIDHLAAEVRQQTGVDINSSREAKQLAKAVCEKAKILLSQKETTKIPFQTVIDGKMVNLNLKVTRAQFEEMIMELVDSTLEKVDSAIAKANEKFQEKGETFTKDDVDTILLVGGSTYIPLVQEKLENHFGKKPSKELNPDLVVGLGAAVHTASGPMLGHKLRIDPLPKVTADRECVIKGRTSSGSTVDVDVAGKTISETADQRGKFRLKFDLKPNATTEINIVATSTEGETAKNRIQIRHDEEFSGEEIKGRKKTGAVGLGLTPRSLGIGITGSDNLLGVVIPAQTQIPCHERTTDYSSTSQAANTPGICPITVYEGDIPYAPLNTQLAYLELPTPATPNLQEPLEISFAIDDVSRTLSVTARIVNYPDRVVEAKINHESPSGDKLHVIERADHALSKFEHRMRPEERVKLKNDVNKLRDLCEQFRKDPAQKNDTYAKIKQVGVSLRSELSRMETAYK